jgi:hypothetical protein
MSDVSGLPDVPGLAAFVQQNLEPQDKAPTPEPDKAAPAATPQQASAQVQAPQTPQAQQTPEVDWAQFKNKDGSLNHEALLKSYKEIQGAYTKTTQERKALQESFEQFQRQIQEQQEIAQLSAIPQRPTQPTDDFDSRFIQDPKAAVESVVEQRVAARLLQSQIEGVLMQEEAKDPSVFQEKYSIAMQLRNRFPQLTQSPMGVQKLMQMADQVRKENLIKQTHRAAQMLFGDDVDIEKLRSLARKTPNIQNNTNLAYMPDTSSSNRTGAESGAHIVGRDAAIQDAVGKGDVDSVLANVFRKALEA